MDNFDFSWVEDAARKAEQYKKDNYYTNWKNYPLDGTTVWDKEIIWIEDNEGKCGWMTMQGVAEILGTNYDVMYNVMRYYLENGTVSKRFIYGAKRKIKNIKVKNVRRLFR